VGRAHDSVASRGDGAPTEIGPKAGRGASTALVAGPPRRSAGPPVQL